MRGVGWERGGWGGYRSRHLFFFLNPTPPARPLCRPPHAMRRAASRQRGTPMRLAGAAPPTCAARCGRGRPADAWHSQRDGGREPLPPHALAARILPVWPASDGVHRGGSDHRGRRRGSRTPPPHVAAMRGRPTTRGTSMRLPPRGCARHGDGGGAAPPSPARASPPPSPIAAAAAAATGREENFWGPCHATPAFLAVITAPQGNWEWGGANGRWVVPLPALQGTRLGKVLQ